MFAAWQDIQGRSGWDFWGNDSLGRNVAEAAVEQGLPVLGVILAVRLVLSAVRRAVAS